MKKALVMALAAAMCVSMAACGQKTETKPQDTAPASTEAAAPETEAAPEEEAPVEEAPVEEVNAGQLEGNRFFFGFDVEGLGSMVQYIHFYDDDLGIGKVFYAGYAWNQITFSGTYTVEETECAYENVALAKGDDAETVSGTAPYTITFFDWDGNQIDQCAYDGEFVYNTTTAINTDPMTGGGQMRLACATAEDLEKYADTFDGELGIAYKSFVDPEDESAFVTLNTNGTYSDMVIFSVDGTWAQTAEGEYTLTPDSESDNGAVLTTQEDGTVTYVSADGTEATLVLDQGAQPGFTFAGQFPLAGMDADLIITTYDDGTCTVVAALAGMENQVDAGTFEQGEDGYTFTFQFDKAGEIVSELGGETGVQVHYEQAGVENIGDLDVMCGVVLP